eukprot:1186421-Prorocentrum_minimum.AAC.4
MSLRQRSRLLQKNVEALAGQESEEEESEEEEEAFSRPARNPFDLLNSGEDDEDEEEEEEEAHQPASAKNPFDLLTAEDEQEEEEEVVDGRQQEHPEVEEGPSQAVNPTKSKKNKKKKVCLLWRRYAADITTLPAPPYMLCEEATAVLGFCNCYLALHDALVFGMRLCSSQNKKKSKATAVGNDEEGEDEEELDDLEKLCKQIESGGAGVSADTPADEELPRTSSRLTPLLAADLRHIKAEDELKRIFGRRVIASESAAMKAEERKGRGMMQPRGLQQRGLKKSIFLVPREHWPRIQSGAYTTCGPAFLVTVSFLVSEFSLRYDVRSDPERCAWENVVHPLIQGSPWK